MHDCDAKTCSVKCSDAEAELMPQSIKYSKSINCRSRMAFAGQWRPRGKPGQTIDVFCLGSRDAPSSTQPPFSPMPIQPTKPTETLYCGDINDFVKVDRESGATVSCEDGANCYFSCENSAHFPTKNSVRCRKQRFSPFSLKV